MQSWYKKFSSQPHQPFFVSGILFFILFMMLFTASYSNILTLDNSVFSFHAYPMVFVIFIQFFLGFLFVVFPRFLIQAEIAIKEYMNQFLLYFFSSLGIFLSLIFFPKITFIFFHIFFFPYFFIFILSFYKQSMIKSIIFIKKAKLPYRIVP